MSDPEMRPYVKELVNQANSSLAAARRWNELGLRVRTAAGSGRSDDRPSIADWFAVAQSILAAAAMFSKILWPNPTSDLDEEDREWMRRRGKSLRRALKITSNRALESRAVRNSFEHFDDRLDRLVREKRSGAFVDMTVGSPEMIQIEGMDAWFLRQIDNSSGNVSVLGDSVNIRELVEIMKDIAERAARWTEALNDREYREAMRQDEESSNGPGLPAQSPPPIAPRGPDRAQRRRQSRADRK